MSSPSTADAALLLLVDRPLGSKPPCNVSFAWLCSDEAESITGRQFVISGNRVSLLYQASETIADRDGKEDAWTPSEIGEKILESMSDWPEPASVAKLVF